MLEQSPLIWPHFNLITFLENSLQRESHSEALGIRAPTYASGWERARGGRDTGFPASLPSSWPPNVVGLFHSLPIGDGPMAHDRHLICTPFPIFNEIKHLF